MVKSLIYFLIIIAAGVALFTIIINAPQERERVINCGIAEISPDFTTEMREACRKARKASIGT